MAFTHAPFAEGSLQGYVSGKYPEPFRAGRGQATEWRENLPFRARLMYVGYERGMSSVKAVWMDEHGNTYPMFVTDLDAILVGGHISYSEEGSPVVIIGTWIVAKRGANYGIRLVTE